MHEDRAEKEAGPLAPDVRSSPLTQVLAHLSGVKAHLPIKALAAADLQRTALVDPLLQALERGINQPQTNFEIEGLLFNHASYLLAKWREARAYPLFIRWFSLPGESALDLGGDTISEAGGRLLASVCTGDIEPLKTLALHRTAHEVCRGQAITGLAVLAAWDEYSREDLEEYLLFLAREGLEREPSGVWNTLALVAAETEALRVFPELKQARLEGWICPGTVVPAGLNQVESAPRGRFWRGFIQSHQPITDVAAEVSHWTGYEQKSATNPERPISEPGLTYVAPPKTGRNDPCPCGSGKKHKKCCGK
jgi:hypothetical protein